MRASRCVRASLDDPSPRRNPFTRRPMTALRPPYAPLTTPDNPPDDPPAGFPPTLRRPPSEHRQPPLDFPQAPQRPPDDPPEDPSVVLDIRNFYTF